MEGIKIRIAEHFISGNYDRKVFGLGAGHNRIDRDLFYRDNAVGGAAFTIDHLIGFTGRAGEHLINSFLGGRSDSKPVGKLVIHEVGLELVIRFCVVGAFELQIAEIILQFLRVFFFLGQRIRQGMNDTVNGVYGKLVEVIGLVYVKPFVAGYHIGPDGRAGGHRVTRGLRFAECGRQSDARRSFLFPFDGLLRIETGGIFYTIDKSVIFGKVVDRYKLTCSPVKPDELGGRILFFQKLCQILQINIGIRFDH